MTLHDRCTRCQARERFARLLVCYDCATRLIERTPQPPTTAPFVPEWRKRDLARDTTGPNIGRAA